MNFARTIPPADPGHHAANARLAAYLVANPKVIDRLLSVARRRKLVSEVSSQRHGALESPKRIMEDLLRSQMSLPAQRHDT